MGKQSRTDLMWSLLDRVVFIILVLIFMFLLAKGANTIAFIYSLVLIGGHIYINRDKMINRVKILFKEKEKLKRLEYYHITDKDKLIDLEKRHETYKLLGNVIVILTIFVMFCGLGIGVTIKSFFGEIYLKNIIGIIGMSVIITFWYGGMLLSIVYRYTTAIYVLTPIVSGMIFWILNSSIKFAAPLFIKFGLYLSIPSIFYFILICFFPVHVLRRLNSKTFLISSFTSIVAVIVSLVIVHNVQNGTILPEEILSTYEISNIFNVVDMKDKQMIELINHLKVKETTDIITSELNLMVRGLTIAYIIGALMIGQKIEKNKKRANNIYRNMVMSEFFIEYKELVKCAFYGGEEYENVLLSNDRTFSIIKANEIDLDIPDVSMKRRIIAWIKKRPFSGLIYLWYKESIYKDK